MMNPESNIAQHCFDKGSELIRIDSSEKHTYVEHILDGLKEDNVCIQGNNYRIPGVWAYDDGTSMTYFYWNNGEPDGNGPKQIVLKRTEGSSILHWDDVSIPMKSTCTYVCEIR